MIQNALNAQSLTLDLRVAKARSSKVQWQGGFTHITQVLMASSGVLSQGGQESAQSAALVIPEGKYSAKYQTQRKTGCPMRRYTDVYGTGL